MPQKFSRFVALTGFLALCSPVVTAQDVDKATLEFVEAKVRPLLKARCYECHSADAKEIKGGLRVDSHAALLRGGESGAAIVPGKPAESLLIEAINYEGYEMPPRSRMPAGEIEILTKWVRLGAPLPGGDASSPPAAEPFPLKKRRDEHWAWAPLSSPSPPAVRAEDWPLDPIDRFVLNKLERAQLDPAPRAARRTLVRRLFFDLIGLPPSPEQVRAFVDDPRNDQAVIASLADELLESPHFGERWGRHWLDLVRYAETLGHEFDYPLHHAHEYRDYVIRALNADVPYDMFATEHIAGDLLSEPRLHPTEKFNESLIGTGFWFLGEAKHAPVDVKGEEAATIDNQLDVFSKTFLGLTVACARCHDHKFDAISTKDYYALSGYLQSSRRQVGLLDPGKRIESSRKHMLALRKRGEALIQAELKQALSGLKPGQLLAKLRAVKDADVKQPRHALFALVELASAADRREFRQRRADLAERLVRTNTAVQQSGSRFQTVGDFGNGQNWSVTGHAFEFTDGTEWDWQRPGVRRLARGAAHSGALSSKLRGVLHSPTFELTHKHVSYLVRGNKAQARLIIDGYRMDEFNGLLFAGAKQNVNTKDGRWRWQRTGGDIPRYTGHRCHIEISDLDNGSVEVAGVRLQNDGPEIPHAASSIAGRLLDQQPADVEPLVAAAIRLAQSGVNGADSAGTDLVNAMLDFGLLEMPDLDRELEAIRNDLREVERRIPAPRRIIAITDGTAEDEHVFIRGSHKTLGEPVPRRFLEAFDSAATEVPGSGRLELVRQIFSDSNPLPARVMVNRVWHHLFGRGIVPTTDNFGVLGKRPTHPELLDHLAGAFRADGWSIKRLIKRMVLTQTYQMASANEPGDRVDPENLLWHRAAVKRLQGEAIRDAMLSVSGRLDRRAFGPSVPVYLTNFMQGRGRPRKSGPLDGNGRRSIYIKVNRNFLSPMLLAFDTPIPFTTIGRRSGSNVPAQALILLNDPFVLQQAETWAKRVMKEANRPAARIESLYRAAFARSPEPAEQARAIVFLQSAGGVGWESDTDAWRDLCHVLFNSKEFVFLD